MSGPRRVLFVNPSPVRGGAEEMLQTLCTDMDPARIQTSVVCLADGPFVNDLEFAGVSVTRLPAGRLRRPDRWASTVRQIARLARGNDLVFSWQVKGHYYGTPAARLARIPSAWWDHGIRPRSGEPRALIDGRLPRTLKANAIVCSSAAAASAIPGAIAIHPGIQIERFASSAERDVTRRSLGLQPSDIAIGIVGRLQPWKGQHTFLRAAAHIDHTDARFLVVGDAIGGFSASYPATLRTLADSLGIASRVSFTGHRTDIPQILSALDVFVHASTDEPFGIAIVEAMAAGLPVVATRGGGVGEIISDGETGLLVPSQDEAALAAAVSRLISDPELSKSLSDAARTHARLWFSNERMIAETTAFIERVTRR